MKGFVNLLLIGLVLTQAPEAPAELLETDDTYIGFQLSVPLGQAGNDAAQLNLEYGFLLVDKTDGVTTGLAWTRDTRYDTDTFGYLPPSNGFLVGKSRISAHTLPLFGNDHAIDPGNSYATNFTGLEFLMYTIGGIYVLGRVIDDVFDSFDDIGEEDEEADEES